MDIVEKMDEGILNVAVLQQSTIKFLLDQKIKQGLYLNRRKFL